MEGGSRTARRHLWLTITFFLALTTQVTAETPNDAKPADGLVSTVYSLKDLGRQCSVQPVDCRHHPSGGPTGQLDQG